MTPKDPSRREDPASGRRCAHEACACAAGNSNYCSSHCANHARDEGAHACGCGHAACENARDAVDAGL